MKFTVENLEEVTALPPGTYHTEIVNASWEEIVLRYNPNRTESLIQIIRQPLQEGVPKESGYEG